MKSVNESMFIDIGLRRLCSEEVLEFLESGNPTSTSDLTIDSRSPSFTPFGGSDFLMEEIDAFLEHDDSIPPGVDGIYDSEGDTVYLEELLSPEMSTIAFGRILWLLFKIPIDPLDKEKTTFTCPYGTFAYRRMPFGLHAPGRSKGVCLHLPRYDGENHGCFLDDFSVLLILSPHAFP
ncbi:hypothetical protein Tco_0025724 [Tanacetum coccineum]